jgi:hypothetical protein
VLAFGCIKIGVQVSGFGIYGAYMKHLTNAEVGMWNAEGWFRFAQSFL